MIPSSLSHFLLLGGQHTTKFWFFFPSLPGYIFHLASGVMLGFPKALSSALFSSAYLHWWSFPHHLMAFLNTAPDGIHEAIISRLQVPNSVGNRKVEFTMYFPPISLSHGITNGESLQEKSF